jgi:alpha-ketoglutaric semialdehyde dehydrogenase
MATAYGLLIGGQWIDRNGHKTIESRSPVNGGLLATFPRAGRADVKKATRAAAEAFPAWRALPAPRRGEILLEAARVLRQRKERLAKLVAREMGKVISEARGDVQEAIDFYEYAAGEGRRLFGITTPSELPNKLLMTRREPLGPVGLITPWNFPIAIPSWKSGAALIAGNTCVLKPASSTPTCAAEFVKALEDAGLPPGVMNLLVGPGDEVGDALVTDERIHGISFTGGTEAGKHVYERAASRMIACGLELGGKNPVIVMDDANQDLAVEGVLFGAFGTAGQRCTATSRLLLHDKIYNRFLDKLVARVEKMRLGDPVEESTDVGPVHGASQLKKILHYIEIGKKEGATLVTGGARASKGALARGTFVKPTIFETQHGSRISTEEIFGPVLSVIRIKSLKQAIDVANGVPYGLSSSIYTDNVNDAFKAVDQLQAGLTYVNAPTIGAETHVPFGGTKATGPTHTREGGVVGIEEFTQWKTVIVEYSGRLQKAQIDTERLAGEALRRRGNGRRS